MVEMMIRMSRIMNINLFAIVQSMLLWPMEVAMKISRIFNVNSLPVR